MAEIDALDASQREQPPLVPSRSLEVDIATSTRRSLRGR
jgi:hypothetical protein